MSILVLGLLAMAGCLATTAPAATPKPEEPGVLRVQGQLTSEGVECPALKGDDGRLYTLATRDLKGFKAGDRVVVEGKIVEVSFCMQGTTISVDSIAKAP
jgi:hypothetical protein